MRKLIFPLVLIVLSTINAYAQCSDIVSIPDSNLKQVLLNRYDTDSDGEICISEALAADEIIIDQNVTDITGINAFENVTFVRLNNSTINSLNLSPLKKLSELYFWDGSGLSDIKLDNPMLSNVDLVGLDKLKHIDFSKCPQLKRIYLSNYSAGFSVNIDNGYIGKRVEIADFEDDICIQVDNDIPFINAGLKYYDDSYQGTVINTSYPEHIEIFAQKESCISNCENPIAFSKDIYDELIPIFDTDNDAILCQEEVDAVTEFHAKLYYEESIFNSELKTYDFKGLSNLRNLKKLTTSSFEGIYYPEDDSLTPYYYSNPVPLVGLGELEYFDNSNIGKFNNSTIDLSNNPKLTTLISRQNGINNNAYIDLTEVPLLNVLDLSDNLMTEVDLSKAKNLTNVNLSANNLSFANVANGNNNNMVVDFTSNPNLRCIQHDEDFDPNSNTEWKKDATTLWSSDCSTAIEEYVYIPDPNFLNAILDHGKTITSPRITTIDTDDNGFISKSEAEAYTGRIDIDNKNINDLKGIEAFSNAKIIDCSDNNIISIDINNLSNLTHLIADNNQLNELILPSTSNLVSINISDNALSLVDFSKQTKITFLQASRNNLSEIYLTNNTLLKNVYLDNNRLKNIDVSNLEKLSRVNAVNNLLEDITFKNNPILSVVFVHNNQLKQLDASNLSRLNNIRVDNNKLTSLNLANGNNNSLNNVRSTFNPTLTCIQTDEGFYPPKNWYKDANAQWSDTCLECINFVNIPDQNLLNAILDNPIPVDINQDGLICIDEAEALSGRLSLKNKNISDLTGIEAFKNITILDCSDNQITSLNLVKLENLKYLICDNNMLNSIYLPQMATLGSISISNNSIDTIDLSNQSNLYYLKSSNNNLRTIDLQQNNMLRNVFLDNNKLTSLDVSGLNKLAQLHAINNQLEQITLNNTLLKTLFVQNNSLSNLDITSCPSISNLRADNNNLDEVNLSNGNNTNLSKVRINNNPNLYCINIDEGFTPTSQWIKDSNSAWNEDCNACNAYVNIPDQNFLNAILQHGISINSPKITVIDKNGDGKICNSEAGEYTGRIDINNKNIKDLTGIEAFKNATILDCSDNELTMLNIATLSNLKFLIADKNKLEKIVLPASSSLTSINCSVNNLSNIDLSNQVNLTYLMASNNQLATIGLIHNDKIENLFLDNNKLTSISINGLTLLKNLYAANNDIKYISTESHPQLRTISLKNNNISSLEISRLTALNKIRLDYNNLITLDLANGNNELLDYVNVSNNPELSCVGIDDNFTPSDGWYKDNDTRLSNDCSICIDFVNIPDANFKAALLEHGTTITDTDISVIDTDGDGEICISEAENYTGKIELFYKQINSLEGIEAFKNITKLNCSANKGLTSIDLSENTRLVDLDISTCTSLTELDLSTNILLEKLDCSTLYNLSTLDLSNQPLLQDLDASGVRSVTALDLSNNTLLEQLDCQNMKGLTAVDLSNNTLLKKINLGNCNLTELELGKQDMLINLAVNGNQLQTLSLNECPNLQFFNGSVNPFNTFDISQNKKLNSVSLENSQLTSILLDNPNLKSLYLSSNSLENLDLKSMPNLTVLRLKYNNFSSLNVSNNLKIYDFDARFNSDLGCIQHDPSQVPGTYWKKDASTEWSTDCGNNYQPEIALTTMRSIDTQVFPNPISIGQILTIQGIDIETVSVFNLLGEQVFSKNYEPTSSVSINTSTLSKGIYLLVINNDQKNKLIVQ